MTRNTCSSQDTPPQKVPCEDCGAMILPRTYEGTGGCCMPCAGKRWAATRKEDPEVKEAIARLEAESSRLFDKWSPVLVDYAFQCRTRDPLPSLESLSDLDRSEYLILKQKMIDFANCRDGGLLQLPNRAVILTSTAPGLHAANEIFQERVGSLVLLLEEEEHRWHDSIYDHPKNAPWWFTQCWWTVRKDLTDIETEICQKSNVVSEGSCRVITQGLQWGPQLGGAYSDLWVVKNDQLEYVRGLLSLNF